MKDDYELFGPEWEKEMMKFKKIELIGWLRRVLIENLELPPQCRCPEKIKHGETSIMCCNECGRPTEEFWTKKINL